MLGEDCQQGCCFSSESDLGFQKLRECIQALSELREMVILQSGEEPAERLRKWRIRRDNADTTALADALNNTCNPFATDSPAVLVNVSSGKTAKRETMTFLLEPLSRGTTLRLKFEGEYAVDVSCFPKIVARTKLLNFAVENVKK